MSEKMIISEVARCMGINHHTLRLWVRNQSVKSEQESYHGAPRLITKRAVYEYLDTGYPPVQMLRRAGVEVVIPGQHKQNRDCRFMAYAKNIDGEWFARVYDNELEVVCFSDLPKFELGKQAALDLACQMATHLEELADELAFLKEQDAIAADYADELADSDAMSGGQG